ncbi:hypothetical protein P170DRAFT_448191 [Aspergillus steynii IBT 23096]|uniref:Uncharacterized protein n=1 Tax=Aspergillus steynii IBT 23096 TaxID=1392250 RepID=A0A2I2G6K4_9EURO|nr:uncharacterized protein P170DRAFT_448191 [Aspergillus steynii IBT 23096]PLB48505.1 hypothetical protein P170DRAFT_448191 [Aspergillus steynii IBT 23096]
MVSNNEWVPKEDRLVRDELYKLEMKIRAWARSYSVQSISDLADISDSERSNIMSQIGHCSAETDWGSLMQKMPISSEKIPAIIIQALLAKDVFEKIFADPFFAFPIFGDDGVLPKPSGMRNLYYTMLQIDEAEAHTWRSQTLRLLWNALDPDSKHALQQKLGEFARERALVFLATPGSQFLRELGKAENETKCLHELQVLFNDATELSLSLWTHRAFMAVRSQRDLPVFTVSSSVMSAHRLHQLDEDDQRLDGSKVLLVVQPAVLACGDENAESYHQWKTWTPANVLVDMS